jgi:hypothetical protein
MPHLQCVRSSESCHVQDSTMTECMCHKLSCVVQVNPWPLAVHMPFAPNTHVVMARSGLDGRQVVMLCSRRVEE